MPSTARSRRSTACCPPRSAARSRRSRRRSAFTRTTGAAPADAAAVLLVADAIRRRRRLRTAYRAFSGEEIGARAQPARARRPLRPLVPRRLRPQSRRPAHLPSRPDVAHCARRGCVRPAAGGVRRRRLRVPLARQRALDAGRWRRCSICRSMPRRGASRRRSAELIDDPEGTLLRMRVDSLDWMASVLARVWTVPSRSAAPTSCGTSVRALADRLASQV